ncbi:helix-turn-helix domain-containing protein [Mycobacterium sp.]|uniref:helix-turn-helix domain-containing protein n=1 Tax=Mycobacterium sp. TaxID=1785 RepID=UPI003A854590
MALLVREVIGDVLRDARTTRGRTLRQVADSARVSPGYLSEAERGRKELSSELLHAICAALEVPMSQVLIDAGHRMAPVEHAGHRPGTDTASAIDPGTKVVIASGATTGDMAPMTLGPRVGQSALTY